MKKKIFTLVFAFLLILPFALSFTGCGEKTFSVSIQKVQGVSISADKTSAKEGEKITLNVQVDESYEEYIYTLKNVYYTASGSSSKINLSSENSTYELTMPKGDITISAEVSAIKCYNEFAFSENALVAYLGTDEDVIIPESYSIFNTGRNYKIININTLDELGNLQTASPLAEMIFCSGAIYVTKNNAEEQFISPAQADRYFANLTDSDFPISIKLADFALNFSDVNQNTYLHAMYYPFLLVESNILSSVSLTFSNETKIEVTTENFAEKKEEILNFLTQEINANLFPLNFTFGEFNIAVDGDDFVVDEISNLTLISNGAFENSFVKSVMVPDSITNIGSLAFSNCTTLETLTISSNVETIQEDVFYGCNNLNKIIIESTEIYNNLLNENSFGNLAANATDVFVLKSIIDNSENDNSFLNNPIYFDRVEESEYYHFIKTNFVE